MDPLRTLFEDPDGDAEPTEVLRGAGTWPDLVAALAAVHLAT